MSEDDKKSAAAPAPQTKPKPVAAAAAPDKPERFTPASESRFMTSVEFKAPQVWYCPEHGTPLAHLLRPEYWASLSRKLPVNAHIHVDAEDGSYYAELKVLKVGQGYAVVMPLRHIEISADVRTPEVEDGYEIQWRGQIVKHRVVRKKDGHVLKQGLDTADDAAAWLRDHKKALAA